MAPNTLNESQIEYGFVGELVQKNKYTYRDDITDRASLEQNFREKFDQLNKVKLTDAEFNRLMAEIVNPDVFTASKTLRSTNTFTREDGTPLHFSLVNLKDWCKNDFEVVKQLRINTANSHHRYDVVLLLNGLPLVQIELKNLSVSPRRAMQQISDYKADAGNGYGNSLMCFIQLFVASNRTETYYFANNRAEHFTFDADEKFLPVYKYADRDNRKINNLSEFGEKFLGKCHLAEMISRYMVLVETEKKILVMRPYQIYAVQDIIQCIEENRGNGFIWHTTGSGKTLTSFKAATLLKDNPTIEKCLFVVDRKDLDRQTREEFNKFQEGCVEENTNTEALVSRMLSTNYADKVIVTTIQKLGIALDPKGRKDYTEQLAVLRDKRMVFIFDECHRSQFGENHKAIKEFFPKAQLFGFTGTPIFEANATYTRVDNGQEASLVTTRDVFQSQLHQYTITHAIEDKNVLKFHIDYFKPEGVQQVPGQGLAREAVVKAILAKHDKATQNREFNAVLATQSIPEAIEYWKLFKEVQAKLQAEDPDFQPLNIACVFSPPAGVSAEVKQMQEDLPNEQQDNLVEPEYKKAALDQIIADYNAQYGTSHRVEEFDLYYQNVQKRIKDHRWSKADFPRHERIDITIVVDMLLTGFDSKFLNTLYVDKNLKYHGLIQAFSRTNRVLNDRKPHGQIMDFRQQEPNVKEAIALFSGIENDKAREIWLVEPAPKVLERYQEAVAKLEQFMQKQDLPPRPDEVANLKGDEARTEFIQTFKEVQRLHTQLEQYTDLKPEVVQAIETTLPTDDLRAFRSSYLEVAKSMRDKRDRDKNTSAEVQQLDFEFVLFASSVVDYDYIMSLMAASTSNEPRKVKMTREAIIQQVLADANLIEDREDMVQYITELPYDRPYTEQELKDGYQDFVNQKRGQELASIATQHNIAVQDLNTFVDNMISRLVFDADALDALLEPQELGWREKAKAEMALMQQLMPLLQKRAEGREISGLAVFKA